MTRASLTLALGFMAALGLAPLSAALAAPPPGSHDPTMHEWFESLEVPGGFMRCCSQADCRNTSIQPGPDGTPQAWIGTDEYGVGAPNKWVTIPQAALVDRPDNPTGHAVVCFWNGRILCFVPVTGI